MAKRRTLVAGIHPSGRADPKQEEAFVYDRAKPAAPKRQPPEPKPERETPPPPPPSPEPALTRPAGRLPLTTRIRADLASELKRASLERQLSGLKPNTVQDILEAALEPWLREHGYLK